jgi:hypothetical protein
VDLNNALKYTTTDINALLPKLAEGGPEAEAGHHHRLVAADAFQEGGREAEANLLRSEFPIYVHKGKVHTAQIAPDGLEDFKNGYRAAAFFSAHANEHGDSPDELGLGLHHLHPDTAKEMDADATHFYHSYGHLIPANALEDAGSDFWFSRNGHGTGFFDADYFDAAEQDHSHELQQAAHKAGEYNLYHDQEDAEYPLKGEGYSDKWGQPAGLQEEQQ